MIETISKVFIIPLQRSDDQPVLPAEDNGGLCYEEHNGVIEIGLDAKIVPTYSFEEIRNSLKEYKSIKISYFGML